MALDAAALARRAAQLGGAEAIASVSLRREVRVQAGPEGALAPPRHGFELLVRLLVRDGAGRIGVARSSTASSPEDLLLLAELATAQAAAALTDLRPLPVLTAGAPHDGHDPATAALDPQHGAGVARQAAAAARLAVGRRRRADWVAEDVELAVADASGEVVTDRRSGARLAVRVADADGVLTGYGQASGASDALIDPIAVGEAASPWQLPVDRRRPGVLAEPWDAVVLAPPALAPLLEALARAACTGPTHATGTSPWTGRLGGAVAPGLVTLIDDPGAALTLPRSLDVEGVAATTVPLLDGGVVAGVLHDSVSALAAGVAPTGHAAELGGGPAGPRARNLVLAGGAAGSIADLLGPVDEAIVIGALEPPVVSPGSTRFTAIGRAAYAVEGGFATRLLGDVVLAGDLTDVVAGLEDLTATPELVATVDRLPERTVAVATPAARVRGLRVLLT